MNIFAYDEAGLFAGKRVVKKPAEGESLPEGTTDIATPEVGDGYQCRWNGADWTIESKRLAC